MGEVKPDDVKRVMAESSREDPRNARTWLVYRVLALEAELAEAKKRAALSSRYEEKRVKWEAEIEALEAELADVTADLQAAKDAQEEGDLTAELAVELAEYQRRTAVLEAVVEAARKDHGCRRDPVTNLPYCLLCDKLSSLPNQPAEG